MAGKIVTFVCALALAASTAAWAQPSTPSLDEGGRIARIDENARVIVLENGAMYRMTPSTVIYVDNQPVSTWNTLRPGQTVVIRSGQPVVYQNGQYVELRKPGTAVSPGTTVVTPGATVAPAPAPAPGTTVVAPAPAPSTVVVNPPPTAAPAAMKRTIYGTITDVDRGEIKVKTADDSFEMKLPRDMTSQLKKGDNVQLDVTVTPSSPSAFPRR